MSGHGEQPPSTSHHVKRKKMNGIVTRVPNNLSFAQKDAESWSYSDVAAWLVVHGFEAYAKKIAFEHKIDGATLLSLTEKDLREKPLEICCLGDIKRIAAAISSLREEMDSASLQMISLPSTSKICETERVATIQTQTDDTAGEGQSNLVICADQEEGAIKNIANGGHVISVKSGSSTVVETAATPDGQVKVKRVHHLTREEIIRQVESPDTKIKSLIKLAIAFCYCTLSLLLTAFVMVLVHDRVPDMKTYPPLPDIVLDNLPLIPWAFEMCELIAVTLCAIWFTVLFFHKHRVVIMRRMFSLVGSVFLLRCVTMLITSLSVPGVHLECRSKSYESLSAKLWQAYHIWSKLGMSIQGVRSCGDYMFSGHTTAVTLLNHLITEYTPDTWHGLHTLTWVLNLFGIFFILAGHEHYSIDVFIAFYISSRMFLYYHAYAYNHYNLTSHDGRMRIWFPLGWFFEAGGQGRVENEFEFPLYIPEFPHISFSSFLKYFQPRRTSKAEIRKDKKQIIPKLTQDLFDNVPEIGNKIRRRKNGKK